MVNPCPLPVLSDAPSAPSIGPLCAAPTRQHFVLPVGRPAAKFEPSSATAAPLSPLGLPSAVPKPEVGSGTHHLEALKGHLKQNHDTGSQGDRVRSPSIETSTSTYANDIWMRAASSNKSIYESTSSEEGIDGTPRIWTWPGSGSSNEQSSFALTGHNAQAVKEPARPALPCFGTGACSNEPSDEAFTEASRKLKQHVKKRRKGKVKQDNFLSALPEIEDNLRFRYTFMLAGVAAEIVRQGLASAWAAEQDEEQKVPAVVHHVSKSTPLSITCHVPDAAESCEGDDAGGQSPKSRLARIRVYTYSKFDDVFPPFNSAMDARNAVAVFALQVNTSDEEINEQIGLLSVLAAQHWHTPKRQRAALTVLLLLGDPGMQRSFKSVRLPSIVAAFSSAYAFSIGLVADSRGEARQMSNLAVALATELGKDPHSHDKCPDVAKVEAALGDVNNSSSVWKWPFRRKVTPSAGN